MGCLNTKSMRIYFFTPDKELTETHRHFIRILSENGTQVLSNVGDSSVIPESEARRLEESGEPLLAKVDGLVIDGSRLDPQSGYLVAYAVTNHKPVLYLMPKGIVLEESLRQLENNRTSGRFFAMKYYSQATLEKILKDFIKKVELVSGIEVPMLKFTLRITPSIDRYLQWKTHNTTLTKADFLRKAVIEEVIKKDKDYEKTLNSEF